VGVPHAADWFEQAPDLPAARDNTIFVTLSIIGDWFRRADGTDGAGVMDGPMAKRAAFERIAQGVGGLMGVTAVADLVLAADHVKPVPSSGNRSRL